jgi:hypothetical protein
VVQIIECGTVRAATSQEVIGSEFEKKVLLIVGTYIALPHLTVVTQFPFRVIRGRPQTNNWVA